MARRRGSSRTCWRESWVGAIATAGDPLGPIGQLAWPAATSPTPPRGSAATRTFSPASGAWRPDGTASASDSDGAMGSRSTIPTTSGTSRSPTSASAAISIRRSASCRGRAVQLFNRASTTARASRADRFNSSCTSSSPSWPPTCRARGRAIACSSRRSTGGSAAAIAFEFNANPTGERLADAFEVRDGVVIAPGRITGGDTGSRSGTAQKRRLYTQVTWWFGGFYDGDLIRLSGPARGTRQPLRHRRILRRAEHRPACRPATSRRRWSARDSASTSRPTCRSASYVQYDTDQRFGRRQHAAALDVPPGGRPVRRLQPQRPVASGPLAARSNQLLMKVQYAWRR